MELDPGKVMAAVSWDVHRVFSLGGAVVDFTPGSTINVAAN
jgi:hypothetical protein